MSYAWQLLSVFNTIRTTIWQEDDVIIDSLTMRMNYQAAVSFLLTSSCLVTFNNWFGGDKPIECITNQNSKPDYMEDYCLIYPKKIFVSQECWDQDDFDKTKEGVDRGCLKDHRTFYYEWTAIFFVAQAICFYVTRFIWLRWENGTMKYLKLTIDKPGMDEDKRAEIAAEIIKERKDKNFNNVYSTGYCFVELVCYVNILLQWKITNSFLGEIEQDWITPNYSVLNFNSLGLHFLVNNQSSLPLRMMFPRQSLCRFNMTGPGGHTTVLNNKCLLTLNIIHDKIFLVMWFLLVFITILAAVSALKRIVLVAFQSLRRQKLKWTYLGREKDGRFHSWTLLNSISVRHSDYLFFEIFGQNFSKSLVRKTLVKLNDLES